MMPSSVQLQDSPRLQANFFSRIFFWWLNDIFRRGYSKNLELNDLYKNDPQDESEMLGDKFYCEWETQIQKDITSGKQTQRKLLRVLYKLFGRRFLAIGLIKCFEECVSKIAIPIILGYLIRFFAGEFDRTIGLFCCAGIILCSTSNILTMHPYFLAIEHLGMQIRLTCSTALYKKALKIKLSSTGGQVTGQMMNLIANDVNRFDSLQHIHYLWIGLTQLAITSYILWRSFGVACLCGLTVLVLFVPFQALLGGIFSKLRSVSATKTDKRIRLISELLKGIRSIKMNCWESTFSTLIETMRKDEMSTLKRITALRSINWSLYYTSSKVAIFLTLVVYVISGNDLTAEIVFVGVSLYNNIRITMTLHFPLGINQLADFFVTVKRVEKFLLIEERKCNKSIYCTNVPNVKRTENKPGRISMKNVSAKWNCDSKENVLTNLNMDITSPQLLTIIGPVGSGKTSLLLVLLQELPMTCGMLEIDGKTSYAGQSPSWLFCGTIKENILFGCEYDPQWYDLILEACALKRDLELFPDGDNTIIGDGTLSGGQQARISLARAVYVKADIYLLDDVFSAVDVEVQRQIFEKCIQNLLKNKLVIFVTHQLQFLESADKIFVIEKGEFVAFGTSSLVQAAQVIGQYSNNGKGMNGHQQEDQVQNENKRKSIHVVDNNCNGILMDGQHAVSPDSNFNQVQGDTQSLQETKSSGCVDLSVYQKYFSTGSNILMIVILVIFNILTQVLHTGSDFWLQIWSKFYENTHNDINNVTLKDSTTINNNSYYYNNISYSDSEPHFNTFTFDLKNQILIYTCIIVFLFIFSMVRTTMFFEICLKSSIKLHNNMLASVIRAPMKFFDLNPTGRILNRFTKDTKLMDEELPQTFFESMEIFLNIIGIIVLVCIVSPYILIPTAFLSIIFYFIRRIYVRSAIWSVQRLESIARSPVYSHISSTLNNGLTTIRAFQGEQNFHSKFCELQNTHSSVFFLTIAMTRWIGMWLDYISVTFIATVVLTLTLTAEVENGGAASMAGMAISSSIFLIGVFQWGVRQSATVESQMVAIERVIDYTMLPSEAALLSSPKRTPPDGWPFEGNIQFVEMSLQYNDSPTLKDINIQIKSKEKIGIVGRTGAGKSSLISALFRLTEPTGKIEIDGVDILQIGLHDLRRGLSIIPQEPFLVQGTLRKNLQNNIKNCSDSDLWCALRDVGLADTIKRSPLGLDIEVNEGGVNFSIGERQLICLAREILRKSKILILDEASASIDERTDILVQKTIREKFEACTVLTIAHRLSTVLDSDRILVLDEGMVKEFDVPHILLQNQMGIFSTMIDQTGEESSRRLRMIAEQEFLRKSLNNDVPQNNESSL